MVQRKERNHGSISRNLFLISHMFYPLLLFCIFWIGINVTSIALAFERTVNGVTQFAGFYNFAEFFKKLANPMDEAHISILNTIKFNLISYICTIPLYFIFSYYLFKKFIGSKAFGLIVMIPQAFSSFIISVLFMKFIGELPTLLSNSGVSNPPNFLYGDKYVLGVQLFYCIWTGFAEGLIIYPNAMRAIPGEILEAAEIDGAGMWHEFFDIVMPLIFPTFITCFVMAISGFFGASGALVLFYEWKAPTSASLIGYYMTKEIMMTSDINTTYPLMSAGGIIFTVIAAPATFGIKALLEHICPAEEY